MNNIQKAFKMKSKLRGMADGGPAPRPDMLGTGTARRAADILARRRDAIDAAVNEALVGDPAPRPAKKPEEEQQKKSTLRSFFGLADGGYSADVDRIMNSRDMSIFSPREIQQFNAMSRAAAANAAQLQDLGLQAGQDALAAARPVDTYDLAPPELELADGGRVKGRGGPTDDKVGPVALSNGEYVLPADTVKAVGRKNLDALRLATHKFVDEDNKPKVSGLRKMANGGEPFYVNSAGEAVRGAMPPSKALVPYKPPTEGTVPRVRPSASGLRKASKLAGRLGSLASVVLGGIDTADDLTSGYSDEFNTNIGATGPISSKVGNVLNFLQNVGNTASFGVAERLGRGLSSAFNNGSFFEGFLEPTDHDLFNRERLERVMNKPGAQRAGTPAVPVDPQSYQSRRLAEMGVPVDQQNLTPVTEDTRRSLLHEGGGTSGQYVNLGSFGGDSNIYGTASKSKGPIDTFVGVGTPSSQGNSAPQQEDPIMSEIRSALRGLTQGGGVVRGGGSVRSNAREINERYDKLANELRSIYSPKGQGNLARRLLELEQSRSTALDADARNQSVLRDQNLRSSLASANADMQARAQALQTLGSLANLRNQQIAKAQDTMLKALQDARQNEEKGFDRYTEAIASMFNGPDGPDREEQEKFTEFIRLSDPQFEQKFTALGPQEQMNALQKLKVFYEMQKDRNATATGNLIYDGAVTNSFDRPVAIREATFNDFWNNHLPFFDYLRSNIPYFTNPNVVVTESGQPVLVAKYATNPDGSWNIDKLKILSELTGRSIGDLMGTKAL